MPKLKAGHISPTVEEDKAITAAARSDPDAKPLTDAQWAVAAPTVRRGRPKAAFTKVAVKLRLDPDVLDALRASGRGWQTQVNNVLRDWVARHA